MMRLTRNQILSRTFELEDERSAILSKMILLSKEDNERLEEIEEELNELALQLDEVDGIK